MTYASAALGCAEERIGSALLSWSDQACELALGPRSIERNRVVPVLDPKRFVFEEARQAFAYLASGSHFGKVVLEGAA